MTQKILFALLSVFFITTYEADVMLSLASVNMCVCLSLCVCPVRALTFESLDLELSLIHI